MTTSTTRATSSSQSTARGRRCAHRYPLSPSRAQIFSPARKSSRPRANLLARAQSSAACNLFDARLDLATISRVPTSQEKAYVTGAEACNAVMGRDVAAVVPLPEDEPHVKAARAAVRAVRDAVPFPLPSLLAGGL